MKSEFREMLETEMLEVEGGYTGMPAISNEQVVKIGIKLSIALFNLFY